MDYRYILTQNTYEARNFKRTSFGIALACEYDGALCILQTISDLSPDRKRVEALVSVINSSKLNPDHLLEIVDDTFAD